MIFYVPPVRAAANSIVYASTTVALSLLMGFPAAYALAQPGRLERFLDPVLLLPLGASAVTLGLGFILAFGPWLASPWLVPVAHTLVALPFVILYVTACLGQPTVSASAGRGCARRLATAILDRSGLADPTSRNAVGSRFCLHHFPG